MASHHHEAISVEEQFEFTSESKRNLLIGGAIGLALVAVGAYMLANGIGEEHIHEAANGAAGHGVEQAHAHGHEYKWTTRIWANIWVNAVYFTGISVIGMFFISYNYLAQAGWSAVFKRIPEAMPAFLPVTGLAMLVTFFMAGHDMFHWTNEALFDKASPEYDAVIAGKRPFLNTPFYLIRMAIYFIAWYGLWRMIRKFSMQEDEIGGLTNYERSVKYGVAFLLVFGVTSSTSAWDFVMAIDTHWFSTMFGWYTLASWHVAGLATMTLTIVTLRERGYLRWVNESHLHDLGKFCFAFTIFWTYVWFAQFLLIYYANLPEEAIYYRERFTGYGGIYKIPFFINILLNFITPFLVLMTRDAKRTPRILKIACWTIIVGHYFDFWNNIMPGTVGAHAGFGPVEFGFVLLFACGFIYSVSYQLTKANLVPVNHPMLEESLYHDIA
jgi:hypothetical protein